MARIRTIKPEFPQSESIGRLSRDARLLFVELWTICDDSGRTRGNSRMLASLLFPYDEDATKLIEGWLMELEREHCIVRYSCEGDVYLEVRNWQKHQKIDKPSPSKHPAFVEPSRILDEPSRKIVQDQGPRTKEGTKDQGEDATGRETDHTLAARMLCEMIDDHDVHHERAYSDMIKSAVALGADARDRAKLMADRWMEYQKANADGKLSWANGSAYKFFTSGGTWDKPELWPWEKGKRPQTKARKYAEVPGREA